MSIGTKGGLRTEEGVRKARGGGGRHWGNSVSALPFPWRLSKCLSPASPCRGSALFWFEPKECKGSAGAHGAEIYPGETAWPKKSLLGWARPPGAQQPLRRVSSVLVPSKAAVSDFCQLSQTWSGSQLCWHPPGRSPGPCPQRSVP